jgi:hypothetical protein
MVGSILYRSDIKNSGSLSLEIIFDNINKLSVWAQVCALLVVLNTTVAQNLANILLQLL